MNLNTSKKLTLISLRLSTIAAAALLAACGGGGGDNATTPAAPTIPASQSFVALQAAGPNPVYTGVSPIGRADAFNYLNNARVTCGFGGLVQNTKLDTMATNHSDYYHLRGNTGDPHYETPGLTGFTGVGPDDRALTVGYETNGFVHESGSFFSANAADIEQEYAVALTGAKKVLTAPYHALLGALTPATEIGIGAVAYKFSSYDAMSNTTSESTSSVMFFNYGYGMTGKGQTPTKGQGVRTYPCNGIIDTDPAFWGEWLPAGNRLLNEARNLNQNPLSSPIYVFGDPGQTLAINSATVTQESTGEVQKVYEIRTRATDFAGNSNLYLDNSSGFIWLDKPYAPGQTYRVVINGTTDGKAFTKTFSFTAGKYAKGYESAAQFLGLPI